MDAGTTEEHESAFLNLFLDTHSDLEVTVDQYARDQNLLEGEDGQT